MGLTPENTRKQRLQDLINLIYSADSWEYENLVSVYALRTGLTNKAIQGMLKIVLDAGLMAIDNGIVKKTEKQADGAGLA